MIATLAGGALIGLAAAWLMAANGRVAGISGMAGGLLSPGACWRAAFLIGLLLYIASFFAKGEAPKAA